MAANRQTRRAFDKKRKRRKRIKMRKKSFNTFNGTQADDVVLEINDREFRCQPSMPGALLLDFISDADGDNPAKMAQAVNKIIEMAIVPDQLEEFKAYIRDPENRVSLDILSEMAGYLSEVYADRPLSSSEPSSPG